MPGLGASVRSLCGTSTAWAALGTTRIMQQSLRALVGTGRERWAGRLVQAGAHWCRRAGLDRHAGQSALAERRKGARNEKRLGLEGHRPVLHMVAHLVQAGMLLLRLCQFPLCLPRLPESAFACLCLMPCTSDNEYSLRMAMGMPVSERPSNGNLTHLQTLKR